jgi:hypothetical protein
MRSQDVTGRQGVRFILFTYETGRLGMNEEVFFNERGIQISNKVLVTKNKTFPIHGITSIRYKELKPGVFKIAGCLIPGILITTLTVLLSILPGQKDTESLGALLAIGIVFLFSGLYFLGARKGLYSVLISGAGMVSETTVLADSNKFFVKRVYRALNQAVKHDQNGAEIQNE